MPYVKIKVTREGGRDGTGPSAGAKLQLIEGVTGLLQDVLGKSPATTVVVIDEIDTDNWGIGGESITDIRSQS